MLIMNNIVGFVMSCEDGNRENMVVKSLSQWDQKFPQGQNNLVPASSLIVADMAGSRAYGKAADGLKPKAETITRPDALINLLICPRLCGQGGRQILVDFIQCNQLVSTSMAEYTTRPQPKIYF